MKVLSPIGTTPEFAAHALRMHSVANIASAFIIQIQLQVV
jgi:hypothetical protein